MRRKQRCGAMGLWPAILALAGMMGAARAESQASVLLRGLSPGEQEIAEMQEWVTQLGANDFQVREAASAKLGTAR